MQEIFLSCQDDNINVQLLRMKSTIKQESNQLKKEQVLLIYLYVFGP